MVKACLQPEPAKRLTALELLALPFFDDIYEHLEGTELQQDYDAVYAAATEDKAPSAHSLWTASSTCTERRIRGGGATLRADAAAKGFLGAEVEDLEIDSAAGGGLCAGRLGRSKSTAGVMLSSAPEIMVPATSLSGGSPLEPEGDRADTFAGDAPATSAISQLGIRALTRASASGLRRATTLGAEDMHMVFSTLDRQGRAVMQPLLTAAEASAAAEAATAAASIKRSAAVGGRGGIGRRAHFPGEGSEAEPQHLSITRRTRASETSGMDLSRSTRHSFGVRPVSIFFLNAFPNYALPMLSPSSKALS